MKNKQLLSMCAALLATTGLMASAAVPNDPQFDQQWGLRMIGATNVWATTTGSTNVVVAIIHSGIRYDHEDLAQNMWRNPGEIPGNNVDDDNNGYVDDVYGFNFGESNSDPMDAGNLAGTAVAGVIGAVSDNAKGMAGLNWSVRLMALRVATGGTIPWGGLGEALKYVAMMKERGVNIPVAYVGVVGDVSDEGHHETIKKLDNLGVLVVTFPFPLTDNDKSPGYPACYPVPNIITVTGLESNGLLTSRAGWGRTTVDLAAPAGKIPTTDGSGPGLYWVAAQEGQFYLGAAHVAGAAALLAAAWPQATTPQIKDALLASVDVRPLLTNKVATTGRLNLGRAMDSLTATMTSPRLSIARSGSSAILTWPTNAPSAVLEQTSTLFPQEWTAVSASRETNGLNITITVPIADRAFFRLRQP